MAEKVDQDVREAAAELWRLLGEHPRAESILAGNHDQAQTVQILARMKEAGRQQGLREAAEVAENCSCTMGNHRDDIIAAITALMEEEGK